MDHGHRGEGERFQAVEDVVCPADEPFGFCGIPDAGEGLHVRAGDETRLLVREDHQAARVALGDGDELFVERFQALSREHVGAASGPVERCPPWRAKRRRVVPGSREATRDTRRAEGAKGDPKGASERGVQSYGRPVCSRNELAMLWRNAG